MAWFGEYSHFATWHQKHSSYSQCTDTWQYSCIVVSTPTPTHTPHLSPHPSSRLSHCARECVCVCVCARALITHKMTSALVFTSLRTNKHTGAVTDDSRAMPLRRYKGENKNYCRRVTSEFGSGNHRALLPLGCMGLSSRGHNTES